MSGPGIVRRINQFIGLACLLAGAIGLLALYIIRREGAFLGLQRWVVPSPFLWGMGSVVLAVFGVQLSWRIDHARTAWRPSTPGRRFESLVLYTRPGCHLCDVAHELLARYQDWLPTVVEVNIDESAELREKFDTCVPVVECDGKVRFRGQISEVLLQRLIEGEDPDIT